MSTAFLTILILGLGFVAFLFFYQRQMIYFPKPYGRGLDLILPDRMKPVEYETAAGRQVAFYLPPEQRPDEPPDRLWLMFGGNASLAVDWLDLVLEAPKGGRNGYLMIDYPGYGWCEGRPTRALIAQNPPGALEALAELLKAPVSRLSRDVGVIGHSLGAAIALDVAGRLKPTDIILIAPFTSLVEMATFTVGWPLNQLVLDRYDNRARLDALAGWHPRPELTIIHGDDDTIVPVRMGRQLAADHPEWVDYIELAGGDHNFILTSARTQILSAMELDAIVSGNREEHSE